MYLKRSSVFEKQEPPEASSRILDLPMDPGGTSVMHVECKREPSVLGTRITKEA